MRPIPRLLAVFATVTLAALALPSEAAAQSVTIDFSGLSSSPSTYTEDGFLVSGRTGGPPSGSWNYNYNSSGHLHSSGGQLYSHANCCSDWYEFRDVSGDTFTPVTVNIPSGSAVFYAPDGSTVSFSSGTFTFPTNSSWQDITHFGMYNSSGNVYFDNLVISYCGVTVNGGGNVTVNEGGQLTLTATGSGSGLSYAWDLDNDGSYDDGTGASVTFDASSIDGPASETVGVQASVSCGETATDSFTVTIDNVAPSVSTMSTPGGDEAANLAFQGAASDPAGSSDPLTYIWDFGDSSSWVQGTLVTHSYADDGSYTVILMVSDDDGGSVYQTATITIDNVDPVIATVAVPSTGDEGQSLGFTAAATDVAGAADPLSYSWEFGDSTSSVSGASAAHTYADNGTYTVTLTVGDGDGGSDFESNTITINNVTPSITSFTGDTSTTEGTTASWSASAYDAGSADTLTYSWNFGDSSTTTGTSVSHAYADDGAYTVALTVTDDDGASVSTSLGVTVANVNPTISYVYAPGGDEGSSLYFSTSATDPGADTLSYSWDFGDSSSPGSGSSTYHSYEDDGSYFVTVTVTEEDGGTASATETMSVDNVAPTVDSLTGDATGDEGDELSYSATASDVGIADIDDLSFTWDFGDGTPSQTGAATTHIFADDGTYTVTVTVDDLDGGTDQDSMTVVVDNVAPQISSSAPVNAIQSVLYTYSPTVSDPGYEVISWSLSPNAPAGMTINTTTGAMAWNPTWNDYLTGTHTQTVTVSDGDGGLDYQTWTITVAASDDDGDLIADDWETANGLDPTDPSDATADLDGDGLSNLEEYQLGQDPASFDGPDVPVLVSPLTDDEVVEATPTLVLENPSDPQGDFLTFDFEVYVDEDLLVLHTSTADVDQDISGDTSWKVDQGLTENTSYWWRARANDGYAPSEWDDAEVFFMNAGNEAPETPTLLSPTDGETVAVDSPVLEWSLVGDPDNDAVSYNLTIWDEAQENVMAEASGVAVAEEDATGTWTVGSDLNEDAVYAWSVAGVDEHGLEGEWAEAETFFYSLDNSAPVGVAFTSPVNGDTVANTSPLLEASEATDAEGDAVHYLFEIDVVSTFDGAETYASSTVQSSGTGSVSWNLADDDVVLASNTNAFARITATDSNGLNSVADTIQFYVRGDNDAPPVPELISPDEGAELDTPVPVLVVGVVADPEGDVVFYDLWVARDAEGVDIVTEQSGLIAGAGPEGAEDRSSWRVDVNLEGSLYWSARAVDEAGAASDWAEARAMNVAGGEAEVPEEILQAIAEATEGCNCSISATGDSGSVGAGFALLLFLVPLARRRRR